MPRTVTVSTGPFKDLGFPGHTDADEFDKEANEVGACVEEADASVAYRSTLPEFHKAFTPTMEGLSGIKRGVNETATAKAKERAKDPSKVEPVLESFIIYANRVKTQLSEADWAALDAAARELAKQTKIDASPSKRIAGPGKELLAKADSWLSTLSPEQLSAKTDKYLAVCEGYDLQMDDAGKPERVSLARLIGKYLDHVLATE